MAVETTTRKTTQSMTALITEYDFTFRALVSVPSDIKCIRHNSATSVDEDMTYVADLPVAPVETDVLKYTVDVNDDGIGGTVEVAWISTSCTITIYRETTDTQGSAYDDYNQFPADTVENDFDKRTMVTQELNEALNRSLRVPIQSTVDAELPVVEGGKYIGWNAGGTALENKTIDVTPSGTTAILYLSNYASYAAAIAAIGATESVLVLDTAGAVTTTMVTPTTLQQIGTKKGVLTIATGSTLTINGPFEAGHYQMFASSVVGDVLGLSEAKSAWWGTDTASVDSAINALSTGGTVYLPKAVNFGVVPLTITAKSIVIKGLGAAFQQTSYGTRITYLGSGASIRLCTASAQAYNIVLEDFMLYGNSIGIDGILVGSGTGAAANYAVGHLTVNRVSAIKFMGAGVKFGGLIWGSFNDCHFDYNAIGIYSTLTLTANYVLAFNSCTTDYNSKEGIFIQHGSDWTFNNHESGANGYEGLKITCAGSRQVNNISFNNCWFEGNQVDAGRTDGYYNILIDSVTPGDKYVGRINLKNNSMRGVTSASTTGLTDGNGQMYIVCSELLLENTAWADYGATIVKPWGYFSTIVTNLIGEDIEAWKINSTSRVEGTLGAFNKSTYGGISTSGTGEDILESFTIPANHLCVRETSDVTNLTRQRYQQGGIFNTWRILAYGTKTGAGGNKTIKLYWGTQVIATVPAANNANDWIIEAIVTHIAPSTQHIHATASEGGAGAGTLLLSDYILGSQAETADIIIKVTGECADAGDHINNRLLSVKPW